MAPRSLLHLFAAIAAAAVFTETAQAGVYRAPDLRNPLEGRIQALRQGSGESLFDSTTSRAASNGATPDGDTRISWWANGGGRGWGNGGFWNGGFRNGGFGNGGFRNGGFRNGGFRNHW